MSEKKIQVIDVQGKVYLGEIKTEANVATISNAILASGSAVTGNDITAYVVASVEETLINKRFEGAGIFVGVSDLDPILSLKFKVENLIMSDAKDRAVKGLVVSAYQNLKSQIGLGK